MPLHPCIDSHVLTAEEGKDQWDEWEGETGREKWCTVHVFQSPACLLSLLGLSVPRQMSRRKRSRDGRERERDRGDDRHKRPREERPRDERPREDRSRDERPRERERDL